MDRNSGARADPDGPVYFQSQKRPARPHSIVPAARSSRHCISICSRSPSPNTTTPPTTRTLRPARPARPGPPGPPGPSQSSTSPSLQHHIPLLICSAKDMSSTLRKPSSSLPSTHVATRPAPTRRAAAVPWISSDNGHEIKFNKEER